MTLPSGKPKHSGAMEQTRTAPARVLAGRYQLQTTLGRGRHSTVYLAHDLHVGNRRVAIKVARPGDESADHLLREAQALATIEHPAVPRLLDVGRGKETVSLVLEYLPGQVLAQFAATAPVAEGDALDWTVRLCDVLIHLHGRRQPLAHGAITPAHCMLLPTGRLVLIDFGTAGHPGNGAAHDDILAVPRVLSQLLTGTTPSHQHSPAVSTHTNEALLWALQAPAGHPPLTLGTFRRLLVECRHALGLRSGICPYCQAATRADARHCGSCGSPVTREPAGAPLPTLRPPDSAPPVARTAGEPSYQTRLRAVGRAIDRDGLRDVILREGGDGFLLRGHLPPSRHSVPAPPAASAKEQVTIHLSHTDLDLVIAEGRRLRELAAQSDVSYAVRPPASSPCFPTGYEDGLRALGYQLDSRGGIADLIIAETEEGLALEYTLVGEAPGAAATRQRLVLSTADMEVVIAEGVDRRGAV